MSSGDHQSTPSDSRLSLCPKCHRSGMRRIERKGVLQKKVFSFFGYFPWECPLCRVVKLFKNRGGRRSRRTPDFHGTRQSAFFANRRHIHVDGLAVLRKIHTPH
jgi:hypothetical protein